MLERFGPATREWFGGAFAAPHRRAGRGLGGDLSRQARARRRPDRLGQDAGRVPLGDRPRLPRQGAAPAPTARSPARQKSGRTTRILYISPLKALGVDVERNLRSPLVGIDADGETPRASTVPECRVGVRSGDTTVGGPAAAR